MPKKRKQNLQAAFDKFFEGLSGEEQELVERYFQGKLDEGTSKIKEARAKERRGRRRAEALLEGDFHKPINEAEFSYEDRRDLLRNALKKRNPDLEDIWVRDIYSEFFVYENFKSSNKFRVDYEIDDDGNVSIGDPVEVVASTVYTQVNGEETDESADGMELLEVDFVPLVESALIESRQGEAKVIQPGWGSSGYYSKDVLERDVPEIFPEGTKMYWDHPTDMEDAERPERSLRDLAGRTTGAPYWNENGPAGAGMYAPIEIFEGFEDAVSELAPHIGVSIRALGAREWGEADDGKEGLIVTEMAIGKSIDFVTEPGAGGEIVALFEAARPVKSKAGERRAAKPGNKSAGAGARRDPVAEHQSNQKEHDMPEIEELRESNKELTEENARLREMALMREAREIASQHLAEADLPDATRKRLVEALAKNPPTDKDAKLDKAALEAAIDEAVKNEVAYLAEAVGSGRIQGMGAGSDPDEVDEEALKEAEASLDSSFEAMGLNEGVRRQAVAGRR